MSAKWGFDKGDIKSAVRHTVIPIVAGGAVAGLEVAQAGAVSEQTVTMAIVTAIVSGIIRALQRWTVDLGPDARKR